jgi:tRNA(fMet)-specific endonuclease VapC
MHLLDTDHISLIARGSTEGQNVLRRLAKLAPGETVVSIVSYEEQMRGWLAEIAAERLPEKQKGKYIRLERMLEYYCAMPILPFDDAAIVAFNHLLAQRLRVGTMDLKIAVIALAHNSVLLSRNLSDFGKIPGLRVEDWSVP